MSDASSDDETAIRAVIAEWHRASAAGDLDAILPLMTDDVQFLIAGQPPMSGRARFAEGFRRVIAEHALGVTADVLEVAVRDDLAYCISQLEVTATARSSGSRVTRRGYVMSVFRKRDGRWLLARDANLLGAPSAPSGGSS